MAASAAAQPGDEAPTGPAECWSCGELVPQVGNTCCGECGEPLTPPRLVLSFDAGRVTLDTGQSALLGRDSAQSPHAGLFRRYPNVSRVHTAVWVDDEGAGWIRDMDSTNGTFVNDQDVGKLSQPVPIRAGDRIRLGADARADVRVPGRQPG